tara:strand:+ start:165 stop:491 length:327 start_codon:yes stop_codon:yes gene_type:complete
LAHPINRGRRYHGDRTQDGAEVWVDGKPLENRTDIREISRDGLFEWSYEGAEPGQLALALLADHLQDDEKALALHLSFMKHIVAYFDNYWEMTSFDINRALKNITETN